VTSARPRPRLRGAALAGLLVVALLAATWPGGAAASSGAGPWWGPTSGDTGFHVRIPVTVTNDDTVTRTDAPVAAELDVAALLLDAGWVGTSLGGTQILDAFELDPDSVRVVELASANALREHDTAFAGDERFVVPSIMMKGGLTTTPAFDARTNPFITVFWKVDGQLAPGASRTYVVYLDSLLNGKQSPPVDHGIESSALASLFWSGPGTRLYGTVPQATSSQSRPQVTIVGLHDGTSVLVSTDAGGQLAPRPPSPVLLNPFTIDAGRSQTVILSTGAAVTFRLEANHPILAFVEDGGYVPASGGGLAGRDFLFWSRSARATFIVADAATTPTTVQVTPMGNGGTAGTPMTFRLNSATNPLPYNLGPDAGSDGACPGTPGPALSGGPVYRARVTEGDPVLLLVGGTGPFSQTPSLTGAPSGDRFFRTLQMCQDSVPADWYAAGTDGATAFAVSSPERAAQIDPPGSASNPTPPPRTVQAAPDWSGPFHLTAGIRDRPLLFSATNDAVLIAGRATTASGGVAAAAGPWGTLDGGRRAITFGETLVITPYAETRLRVESKYQLTGAATETLAPSSADQLLRFSDGGGQDRLLASVITADKPFIAYPVHDRPTALAGHPGFLASTPGAAQFRGHLIALESPTGLDPVAASTLPGEPVVFKVLVRNLGRDAQGNVLADSVRMAVSGLPTAWTASMTHDIIQLPDGRPVEVDVTVTPPGDATAQSRATLTITATSKGNANVADSLQAIAFVKRAFDVGVWFDFVNGPKTQTVSTRADVPQTYDVIVQNLGTVSDVILLELDGREPTWQNMILLGAEEVQELALDAAETRRLELVVTPPEGKADGIQILSLTARSGTSPAAFDRVVATTRIRAPAELEVTALQRSRIVEPGVEALFDIQVRNDGEGSTEVLLGIVGDPLANWTNPPLFHIDPTTGDRVNLTSVTLAPGDEILIHGSTTPPMDAPAGLLRTLRVEADPGSGQPIVDALLTAVVANVHALDVEVDPPFLTASSTGRSQWLNLTLLNGGNLDEVLVVRLADAPTGWSLVVPDPLVALPMGAEQTLAVVAHVPEDAAPTEDELLIELVSADGNVTKITVPLRVPATGSGLVLGGADAAGRPGAPVWIPTPVTNTGNVPVQVRVVAAADEPWPLSSSTDAVIALLPRETVPVMVGWNVPRSAPDGVSVHSARITLTPTDPGVPAQAIDVDRSIAIGRPDLSIKEVVTSPGPSGTLVLVEIENRGDREATAIHVRLEAGRIEIASQTLARILPEKSVQVALLDAAPTAGRRTVVVDPTDELVERDESDNTWTLEAPAEAAPGPAALLLLLVLGAAAGRRRY
jgi:uncharacterized membrane protein